MKRIWLRQAICRTPASDYAMGNLPGEMVPVMAVKGTICAMDSEVSGYYHEPAEGNTELEALMLPYYPQRQPGRYPDSHLGLDYAGCLRGSVAHCYCSADRAINGGYQKDLKKKVASMGEEFHAGKVGSCFMRTLRRSAACGWVQTMCQFQSALASVLPRSLELAWAYQSTTAPHQRYSSGKTYATILRNWRMGAVHTLSMNKNQVQESLDAMHTTLPGTVLGYTKELKACTNDRGWGVCCALGGSPSRSHCPRVARQTAPESTAKVSSSSFAIASSAYIVAGSGLIQRRRCPPW